MKLSDFQVFGLCCPACVTDARLQVWMEAWVSQSADEADSLGHHAWDDDASCRCLNCGFFAPVAHFQTFHESILS